MNNQLISQVAAFVWQEADMLDHTEYADWLDLWTADGLYIVPIDPNEKDFANTLNYAHDDGKMRKLRVERLLSGESVSTTPAPTVVRSASRFRILANDGKNLSVRCAQHFREFNKHSQRHYSADVTYDLIQEEGGFKLHRKIVRLVNSTNTLQAMAFIL